MKDLLAKAPEAQRESKYIDFKEMFDPDLARDWVEIVKDIVAMANSGPGTNGSQFFLVYRDSLALHPNYTPFGTVVKGLGIIQNVAKAGTDNANGPGDGHPKEKVVIERVIIKKP